MTEKMPKRYKNDVMFQLNKKGKCFKNGDIGDMPLNDREKMTKCLKDDDIEEMP
jgi:hypothetical protein